MHIVMVTTGTLGDVQPFVALGVGLRREGYEVTLATHPDYEALITGNGLAFRRVGVNFKEQMESPADRNWIESGDSLVRYKEALRNAFVPMTPRWIEDARAATLDADVLLLQPFAALAYHQAEQRGIPALCVSPFPIVVTGEIEPAFWPAAPRWRWLRRRMNAEAGRVGNASAIRGARGPSSSRLLAALAFFWRPGVLFSWRAVGALTEQHWL